MIKKYEIKPTNKFKKDLQNIKNRSFFDEDILNDVIEMLSKDEVLPSKYCNHLLEPKKYGLWECHIKPDWLLIYKKDKNLLVLVLTRTGTHSDLFK